MQRVDEEIVNYDLIEDVLLLLLVNRDQCTLEAPEGSDLSRGSILGTACRSRMPFMHAIASLTAIS